VRPNLPVLAGTSVSDGRGRVKGMRRNGEQRALHRRARALDRRLIAAEAWLARAVDRAISVEVHPTPEQEAASVAADLRRLVEQLSICAQDVVELGRDLGAHQAASLGRDSNAYATG
jgi:hypothetical protein